MKNIARRTLQRLVRYLAPHVGLGVFELPEFKCSEDPEDIAFLLEEIEVPPEWLSVTLH
jgi:hypothetical protein